MTSLTKDVVTVGRARKCQVFPTKLFSSNEQSSPANPGRQIQCTWLEEFVVLTESLKRLDVGSSEHWPLVLALLGVFPQESGHRGTAQSAPP